MKILLITWLPTVNCLNKTPEGLFLTNKQKIIWTFDWNTILTVDLMRESRFINSRSSWQKPQSKPHAVASRILRNSFLSSTIIFILFLYPASCLTNLVPHKSWQRLDGTKPHFFFFFSLLTLSYSTPVS